MIKTCINCLVSFSARNKGQKCCSHSCSCVSRERKKLLWAVNEVTGCWDCTSHSLSEGYPVLQIDGEQIRAHRFIYQELFGDIPKGLVIRHKCDNRQCINPEHLVIGTKGDNNRDCSERGRKNPRRGEDHQFAKLTNANVLAIREALLSGQTPGTLAPKYGVSYNHIYHIKHNRNWKHLKAGEATL